MILIAAVAVYYGVGIGAAYLRFYRFRDAMSTEARFAQAMPVDSIVRHLRAAADSLGLPAAAQRVQVSRTPRSVQVSSAYVEVVEVPFGRRSIRFTPSVERTF